MRLMALLTVISTLMPAQAGEDNRTQAANLVPNGTFDENQRRLVHWDPLPGDGSVRWLDYSADRGKVIVFDLKKEVAEGTGLLFYSDFIPVTHGRTYRFSVDYKSLGPRPKPFVKGYVASPDVHGKVERREYYKKQIFVKEPSPEWTTISMTFTPKNPYDRAKHEIKWVRVLLYAYLRPGQIYFDNVRLQEVE